MICLIVFGFCSSSSCGLLGQTHPDGEGAEHLPDLATDIE